VSNTQIMHGAEPFFLPGNKVGCLIIHGFTGTPKEMRWMGEYLQRKGFTVFGVRLAGHATQIEDLVHSKWQDWILSVEEGIDILKNSCSKVFTIGLSMGGILSLIAANRFDIEGSVCMSTPYEVSHDWRLKFAKPLSLIIPSVAKGKSETKNKIAAKSHLDYPVYPTRAIAELNCLLSEMHRILPEITKPVLLIHSKGDGLSYKNSEKIYNLLTCKDKELYLLEKSGHIITEDIERIQVFEKAEKFIKRLDKA
jgi:carboxylesterase